jgi:hypothetical protein
MSAETQILDAIKPELLFMQRANGYSKNLSKAIEGYKPLSVENDFDCAYFFMGNRQPYKKTSDNKPYAWIGDLWIIIQLKSSEGNLSRDIEAWIQNIRDWLWQGSGITANKWFTLDTSLPQVASWNSKDLQVIEPNSLWDKHISELTFKLNIIYST